MMAFLAAWRQFIESLNAVDSSLSGSLQPGISPGLWSAFAMSLDSPVPAEVEALYLENNGEGGNASTGLFFACRLLTLREIEDVRQEWLGELEAGYIERESPMDSRIAEEFPSLTHLPIFADGNGNFLGVDLVGGMVGNPGQIIAIGADFLESKWVCASMMELIESANQVLSARAYVVKRDLVHSSLPWMELSNRVSGPLSRWIGKVT